MPLYLLTHERELTRPSNTGRLAQQQLSQHQTLTVRTLLWQRKSPSLELLQLAEQQQLWLLYPASADSKTVSADTTLCLSRHHLVLLDATWQESQKMLRQSPYLQQLPRYCLPQASSEYCLRRNQQSGALCSAEVVVQLLQQSGWPEESAALAQRFAEFNRR